eukprot:3549117-Amphidinium_carterae.2
MKTKKASQGRNTHATHTVIFVFPARAGSPFLRCPFEPDTLRFWAHSNRKRPTFSPMGLALIRRRRASWLPGRMFSWTLKASSSPCTVYEAELCTIYLDIGTDSAAVLQGWERTSFQRYPAREVCPPLEGHLGAYSPQDRASLQDSGHQQAPTESSQHFAWLGNQLTNHFEGTMLKEETAASFEERLVKVTTWVGHDGAMLARSWGIHPEYSHARLGAYLERVHTDAEGSADVAPITHSLAAVRSDGFA